MIQQIIPVLCEVGALRRSGADSKCYVANYAVYFDDKIATRIQEERPASYLMNLHEFIIESVSELISHGKRGFAISAAVVREIGLSLLLYK